MNVKIKMFFNISESLIKKKKKEENRQQISIKYQYRKNTIAY